jgi:hypothetical protein
MNTRRVAVATGLLAALLAALLGARPGYAAEGSDDEARVALDATVISGAQELPKVLYIVPWQAPTGRPALPATAGVVDDGFWQPIQPPEHRREVLYQERLGGESPQE